MENLIEKEKGNWLYTICKIVFWIAVIVLVMLTILANMGGKQETHKVMVEDFASELTGYNAKIKTLNKVSYFPSISVDFEDMDFFAKGNIVTPVAHIDRAQTSVSFWDVMRQTGRFKILNLQGISALPGVALNKGITLKHFSVVDSGDDGSKLEAQGTIGDAPLAFTMGVISEGAGKGKNYTFEGGRAFQLDLGDLKFTGRVQNNINPAISLQDIKVAQGGNDVVTGQLDLSNRRKSEVTISGEIHIGQTILRPDLVLDRAANRISGVIAAENFSEQNLSAGSDFDKLIRQIVHYIGDPAKDGKKLDEYFASQDIMLDINGQKKKLAFVNNTLSLK